MRRVRPLGHNVSDSGTQSFAAWYSSRAVLHASFGGLGIAFTWEPDRRAMLFRRDVGAGHRMGRQPGRIRDPAIGIICWWAWPSALFISAPGHTSGDLSAYLFGSIVTVTDSDVAALAALTLLIIAGALLWLRPVMYVLTAISPAAGVSRRA